MVDRIDMPVNQLAHPLPIFTGLLFAIVANDFQALYQFGAAEAQRALHEAAGFHVEQRIAAVILAGPAQCQAGAAGQG
jgi:hypothetical protein